MKDFTLKMEKYDVRKYWNKRAEIGNNIYEKVCAYGEIYHFNKIMDMMQKDCLNFLLKNISVEGKRVLEIGCGVGRWGQFMIGRGAYYTGVDISPKMIEIAKRNVPNSEFYVIDGEKLDFPDNYFDLTFSVTVLHHNPNDQKRKIIREMCRVTKEGGHIIIIEDISYKKLSTFNFNMFPLSPEDWIKEFSRNGCIPVKLVKHKFLQGILGYYCKRFPKITSNILFMYLWAKIIEKLAQKTMPYRLFAGVGILFLKRGVRNDNYI